MSARLKTIHFGTGFRIKIFRMTAPHNLTRWAL